jgi:hypothetical protein
MKLLWQQNVIKSSQATSHINLEKKSKRLLLRIDVADRPRRFYHKDILLID